MRIGLKIDSGIKTASFSSILQKCAPSALTPAKADRIRFPAQSQSSVSQLLALLLCASIFAWGTQAKLSLYRHASPGHPENIAKLLPEDQGNKRSSVIASVKRVHSSHPAIASIERLQASAGIPLTGPGVLAEVVRPPAPALFHELHFRPPPSLF